MHFVTEPCIALPTEGLARETVVKRLKLSRFATDISLSTSLVQKYLQYSRPPLSSAKVKNAWNYNSTPPYTFMMCTGTNVLSH